MAVLYLIATPIGNLEDVTHRALRVLRELPALACEDTRRTRRLLERYEIPRPPILFACHEHNEQKAAARITSLLNDGKSVGLCTNAGYPGISDPGYPVIDAAVTAGARVEVIPGTGAVEAALLLSGLPSSSYTFKGFPPRKQGRRTAFLAMDSEAPHTLVFFESPRRLAAFLQAAAVTLGDRRAAVCFEMTKRHERVNRGYLSDLSAEIAETDNKGEVTVVIAGKHQKFVRDSAVAAVPPPEQT